MPKTWACCPPWPAALFTHLPGRRQPSTPSISSVTVASFLRNGSSRLRSAEPRIHQGVYDVLSVEASVNSRTSYGGTAPANVAAMAAELAGMARWDGDEKLASALDVAADLARDAAPAV